MASFLINKPLTSLCNSKSEFCPENPLPQRGRFGVNSVSFKNVNSSSISSKKFYKEKASFSSVTCQAVSIEQQPVTEVEGLNIAEDVTQVGFIISPGFYLLNFHLGFFFLNLFIFICSKNEKKNGMYTFPCIFLSWISIWAMMERCRNHHWWLDFLFYLESFIFCLVLFENGMFYLIRVSIICPWIVLVECSSVMLFYSCYLLPFL